MYTNVNLAAPPGILMLLGTGFLFFIAFLVFLFTIFRQKFRVAKLLILGVAVVAAIYLGLILMFSFTSTETVLARGQEKHFCEIDCHLAYSIVDVTQTKSLGNAPNQTTAVNTFYIIAVKTRFDEETISPSRGNGLLYPNSRVVTVIDQNGTKYSPSIEGQRVLEESKQAGTPITAPLRPSESYTTTLVFDLPSDIRNPTLLINEGDWITHLLLGHENSPLHKKTRFQI